MQVKVLIAHADGEAHLAEEVAKPLQDAGYAVAHSGTVLVGDSMLEDASSCLGTGSPLILCATVRAMGTGWAHRLVNAARTHPGVRPFVLQMDQDA